METDEKEIEYYRSVEDHFAALRGTPHVLSPRDFQLLRTWWREGVPLAAVTGGLTEVFARNRDREDADPVVSLSYCRHAVKRHAKRLSEMHVGQADSIEPSDSTDAAVEIDRLRSALIASSENQHRARPAVSRVLTRIAEQIGIAGGQLPPDVLDQHLYALESEMLHDCWLALTEDDRHEIDARVGNAAGDTSSTEEARQRSLRALRDREIRLLLGLPRIELGP